MPPATRRELAAARRLMRRRRCAFCLERAIVQCDGRACIRKVCADHRHVIGRLFFCPLCKSKARAAAATPEQTRLFRF